MAKITRTSKQEQKERLRAAMDDFDTEDVGDGAYWAMVHDACGLEYGDAFDLIAEDPAFFGATPCPEKDK